MCPNLDSYPRIFYFLTSCVRHLDLYPHPSPSNTDPITSQCRDHRFFSLHTPSLDDITLPATNIPHLTTYSQSAMITIVAKLPSLVVSLPLLSLSFPPLTRFLISLAAKISYRGYFVTDYKVLRLLKTVVGQFQL